ncbi:MAG TPA: hypothetical protein VEI57_07655 [Nitrospirota bacterium]|nr:hypothetical protein [Nitrospirota bacterium]
MELKQTLINALEANDYETVRTLALQSRKVFSVLVRLAYDKTTLIGWRSISAIGHVASLYVKNNYDFLRDAIRKLLWSLSDESGGIGWSAPEILGEIVSADPGKMSDVIPLIADIFTLDERVFRPGVLYALKRISETQPGSVVQFKGLAMCGLTENDPLARIYALELVHVLKEQFSPEDLKKVISQVENLKEDEAVTWVYRNDSFEDLEVKEIAKIVYNNLLK